MTGELTGLVDVSHVLSPTLWVSRRRALPADWFPNLRAATFQSKTGTCLLAESAQSMANRSEAVCWDEAASSPRKPLAGLSSVRAECKGRLLTSSLSRYVAGPDVTREIGRFGPDVELARPTRPRPKAATQSARRGRP